MAALALSGLVAALVRQSRDQQTIATDRVVFASVGGAALAAGLIARQWQAIRRQLASERRLTEGERARRLLAEEKTRIARELHDVIAHSMSIISIQATSAPVRHPGTSGELQREFEEIASSSRRALTEMRSLLGILRDPDAPASRTPAPRLAGITELVQQSRRSGLSVRLVGAELLIDDDRDEAVGVAGFRIVQEALSNVIRHAPGAEAEVRITRGADLQIVVANTAPSLTLSAQRVEEGGGGQGAGLLGMRERAAAAGGTVVWGPDASGGYEVRLALPLTPPPSELEEAST